MSGSWKNWGGKKGMLSKPDTEPENIHDRT
jgi:hypothetical protein